MAELIVGTYRHERSENFDEYFKAVGVPYIGRKMMAMSNPRLEIETDGEKWIIRSVSAMRTSELTFVPGTEYEESMPSGDVVKNVTDVVDGRIVTNSISPNGSKLTRTYEFNPEGAILYKVNEDVFQARNLPLRLFDVGTPGAGVLFEAFNEKYAKIASGFSQKLTMTHEASGQVAKRFYKRVVPT